MRAVGTFEAKNTLSALLDLVQTGEEVVITRNGKPMARLIKEDGEHAARLRAQRAAKAIGRLSKGATLGGTSLRDLIDEGRR